MWEEVPGYTPSFAVCDVFSLRLGAPVIVLIACESAHHDLSPGEEPMGLVSAFLVAGAKSVLGTLWTVASESARLFSNYFYTDVYHQSSRRDAGLVDLARSVQQAVLEIRRSPETRSPYHWAAFVLHGAWLVRIFHVAEVQLEAS